MSVQLFGHDADVMRVASGKVAEAGADLIDINMGCPSGRSARRAPAPRCSTTRQGGRDRRAAREGSGLPVTVKLRPGQRPGERNGVVLARRLVEEAGVAGIAFHPRHASQQHKGKPDYALARELVEALDVPVIVSGGLSDEDARCARSTSRRGGRHARARLARESMALRAPAGPAGGPSRRAPRSARSSCG